VPELPDITAYSEALGERILGARLERLRIASPFLLRSVDPPPSELEGRAVDGLRRVGKRIVIELHGELFLVLHLMIAGRLRWKPAGAALPGKLGLAAFDFSSGTLILTEAGSKRRASLHLVRGAQRLSELDPGGIEPLTATLEEFQRALTAENHTLKRALTDPQRFSGIGNAYSDEILHAARLSPLTWTQRLEPDEIRRLFEATRATLTLWIERLRSERAGGFPEHVTAFRPEMSVHGRFRQPCPVCSARVQRIVHSEREMNYCARCQTGGKLLADRALSRLLKGDWPKTIDEWERARPR
jgi:formamidopyrimidine-DNA glycosylase